MKDAFSKDDQDFAEMLFRNAGQQDLYGGVGNELFRDIVIDKWGGENVVRQEISVIRTDENGIPFLYRERTGKILDCGHLPGGLEGVGGMCDYGHMICAQCSLYVCDWCGAKLCDYCVIILNNGMTICSEHRGKLLWKRMKGLIAG